jgi:tetratricopeptide (TPR) repeat protein
LTIHLKPALFAALLVTLAACGDRSAAPERPTVAPHFIGSTTCSSCHQAKFDDWQGSHHELAIQVASKTTVLGDFDSVEFDYFGKKTRFTTRGDDFFVTTEDAGGQNQEYRIAYTFGVTPLQQYLVEFPGGRMQALPFSWDTRPAADGGVRWFHLYPDEYLGPGDELYWTGRYQNWNYMCAECHSTDLKMGYDADTDTFATTYSELPVGCEACHGPGSEHVSQAEADEFGTGYGLQVNLGEHASRSWVMNLESGIAELSAPTIKLSQEVESCGRCHARRGTIATQYEYGETLTDTHLPALLDENLYFPDGQIKDEVYVYGSFIQSRMYHAGVTCSDCHNPHTATLRTGPTPSDVCAQCHLSTTFATPEHSDHASTDATCVDCHMAARTYMGVDARRDHSFRIPRPDLHSETGAPNACNNCHTDKDAAWASGALATTGASLRPHYATAIAAGRLGHSNDLLTRASTNEDFPAIARATMLTLLTAPFGESELDALNKALQDPDPLLRIAALRMIRVFPAAIKMSVGGETLHDPILGVRLQAALTFANIRDLLPLEQTRAFGRAAEEYRAAYTMLSSTPDAAMNLGNFEQASGNLLRAISHFERALEIDPGFAPARLNLVDALRRTRDETRTEELLLQGIALTPDNAALHHSLGLALIRTGQSEAGLIELRQAFELQPSQDRYAYVLGVALNSLGQQSEALVLLEDVYQESPANYDIGWALATILRDSGDYTHAQEIAAQLAGYYPDDESIRTLRQWLAARIEP